jgi:hypothetical protein
MDQMLPPWIKPREFRFTNAPNSRTREFLAHTHSPNTHKLGKHFGTNWQPRGILKLWKIRGGWVLCIGPESSGRPAKGAYVRWLLPSGSKAVSYVQVLSKGYSKKVMYVWWSRVRPPVRFAECTSGGRSAYVRTTDNSVCPPNLAYVCPKVQITLLTALVTQSPN